VHLISGVPYQAIMGAHSGRSRTVFGPELSVVRFKVNVTSEPVMRPAEMAGLAELVNSMADIVVTDARQQRWIVGSIALAVFMCTLDNYIVNISLPTIASTLHVSTTTVSRIIIAYLLILTSTIPFYGKLSDTIGLIRVFIAGYVIFTVGSLLCGISTDMTMLVLSRCLQGFGGSALFTVPSAIITRYLPQQMRGAAFGVVTTAAAIGFSVGSPLGGVITSFLSWHWIFLINIPVGIIAIAVTLRYFPKEEKVVKPSHGFDTAGLFLSFFGLILLMFSLNMGREIGWTSPLILGSLSSSLILLTALVLWEKRCSDPLLDFSIFRFWNFTFANISNFFVFMAASGTNFILPFYLIQAKSLEEALAGIVLMSFSLVNMTVGPVAGRISDRISPRILCVAGTAISLAACLIFAGTLKLQGLWPVLLFLITTGFSIGLFLSPNNNQIMTAAPQESHGMASGILRTVTNLGAVVGVGIFEIVYSASHHNKGIDAGNSQIPQDLLMSGFSHAFLLAAIAYALALISSLLTRTDRGSSG